MGGTANLAVFGGNLPPSLGLLRESSLHEAREGDACGLVAHRNGQVARSTHCGLQSEFMGSLGLFRP